MCRAAGSGPLGLCARCAGSLLEPIIDPFELSLGPYSGPLERAIRAYKFGGCGGWAASSASGWPTCSRL